MLLNKKIQRREKLTNLVLSKIPAIIPARNAAQFNCAISTGTETNEFVTGENSWIMSAISKMDKLVNYNKEIAW